MPFDPGGAVVRVPDGEAGLRDLRKIEFPRSALLEDEAVRQGVADILDLVEIFKELRGAPVKVYVTGASEGGLITTLLVEGYGEVFTGGLAACASPAGTPVGGSAAATGQTAPTGARRVEWGGTIIAVSNQRDSTELEVLAYPLTADGRPDVAAPSSGRFVAVRPGFLEWEWH